jgi:hypothetical protein
MITSVLLDNATVPIGTATYAYRVPRNARGNLCHVDTRVVSGGTVTTTVNSITKEVTDPSFIIGKTVGPTAGDVHFEDVLQYPWIYVVLTVTVSPAVINLSITTQEV